MGPLFNATAVGSAEGTVARPAGPRDPTCPGLLAVLLPASGWPLVPEEHGPRWPTPASLLSTGSLFFALPP